VNDTEEAVRRLLTAATEDIPPGMDLLRGVRTRSRRRVVRLRAVAAAGAAGIVAAAAITLSAVPAPSALAQVKQALARTTATSYRLYATDKIVKIGGLRSQPWSTVSGEFDLARGVGEQTDNLGAQIRYVGGYTYVFVTDDLRAASRVMKGTPIPDWAFSRGAWGWSTRWTCWPCWSRPPRSARWARRPGPAGRVRPTRSAPARISSDPCARP